MIRSKDSRIQSLEDQLVKNARLFAKEATDLKLRIQEYQMANELVGSDLGIIRHIYTINLFN